MASSSTQRTLHHYRGCNDAYAAWGNAFQVEPSTPSGQIYRKKGHALCPLVVDGIHASEVGWVILGCSSVDANDGRLACRKAKKEADVRTR